MKQSLIFVTKNVPIPDQYVHLSFKCSQQVKCTVKKTENVTENLSALKGIYAKTYECIHGNMQNFVTWMKKLKKSFYLSVLRIEIAQRFKIKELIFLICLMSTSIHPGFQYKNWQKTGIMCVFQANLLQKKF